MPSRKIRVLELARVGQWGLDRSEITTQNLKDVVETYAGKRPVTIGHDGSKSDSLPKFGDVLDAWLSDDGTKLIGPVMFTEAGDKLYESGAYDGWSVSIPPRDGDGKRVLHHLAILGGTPPKIPGLEELVNLAVSYSETSAEHRISFSGEIPEYREESKQKEEDVTETEKKELEELRKKNKELEEENKTLKKQEEPKPEEKKQEEPKPEEKADTGKSDKDFSDMQNRIKQMEAERQKERVDGFRREITGKVPVGIIDKAAAIADRLYGAGSVSFSDNGKTENKDALSLFSEILALWPRPNTGASGNDYSSTEKQSSQVDWSKMASKM
jgi:hypothetical protein